MSVWSVWCFSPHLWREYAGGWTQSTEITLSFGVFVCFLRGDWVIFWIDSDFEYYMFIILIWSVILLNSPTSYSFRATPIHLVNSFISDTELLALLCRRHCATVMLDKFFPFFNYESSSFFLRYQGNRVKFPVIKPAIWPHCIYIYLNISYLPLGVGVICLCLVPSTPTPLSCSLKYFHYYYVHLHSHIVDFSFQLGVLISLYSQKIYFEQDLVVLIRHFSCSRNWGKRITISRPAWGSVSSRPLWAM